MAFGTDGEQNLADALKHQFPFAAHVRCFRHLRGNIDDHLQAMGLSKAAREQFLRDIFGWREGGKYYEGLVDSDVQETF